MIRMLLSFWYREDIFHIGISSLAFKKKKEDPSVFLIFAVFLMPLTQKKLICQSGIFWGDVLWTPSVPFVTKSWTHWDFSWWLKAMVLNLVKWCFVWTLQTCPLLTLLWCVSGHLLAFGVRCGVAPTLNQTQTSMSFYLLVCFSCHLSFFPLLCGCRLSYLAVYRVSQTGPSCLLSCPTTVV